MNKKKNKAFKTGSLFLAPAIGLLAISPVFAINNSPNTSPTVDIVKTLYKNQNVPIPNTPIRFDVRPATEKEVSSSMSSDPSQTNPNVGGVAVYPGVAGVFQDTPYEIAAPSYTDRTSTDNLAKADGKDAYQYPPLTLNPATLVTDPTTTFPRAGLYRYVVTEVDPSFPGLKETAPTSGGYYLDVYVVNKPVTQGQPPEREIADVFAWDTTKGTGSSMALLAKYKTNKFAFTNTYITHSLTVSKTVAGNAADMTKKFEFTLSLTPDENDEVFVLDVFNSDGSVTQTLLDAPTLGTAITKKVSLGNGESFTVFGLSAQDQYSVVESDAQAKDGTYTVGINQGEGSGTSDTIDEKTFTVSGNTDTSNDVFKYTNTRTSTLPTNYISTYGPYIAGLAVLGGLGFAMLRKKKASE